MFRQDSSGSGEGGRSTRWAAVSVTIEGEYLRLRVHCCRHRHRCLLDSLGCRDRWFLFSLLCCLQLLFSLGRHCCHCLARSLAHRRLQPNDCLFQLEATLNEAGVVLLGCSPTEQTYRGLSVIYVDLSTTGLCQFGLGIGALPLKPEVSGGAIRADVTAERVAAAALPVIGYAHFPLHHVHQHWVGEHRLPREPDLVRGGRLCAGPEESIGGSRNVEEAHCRAQELCCNVPWGALVLATVLSSEAWGTSHSYFLARRCYLHGDPPGQG